MLSCAHMLQTQDNKKKHDMSDDCCRPKIPFTLKFDSPPRAGTHNFMQICACTYMQVSVLASAPLHTQDTELGLGALVWQPQPSFSISDKSCFVAKKSRRDCEQNSTTEDEGRMRVAWRKSKREQKRGQRGTKQERQSDATNLNSKTWGERSRQNAALLE